MPVRYEEATVMSQVGMTCDVCGKDDEPGDFVLRYTFGYGTERDGDQVEAAVCDRCLISIVRARIPNAAWIDS